MAKSNACVGFHVQALTNTMQLQKPTDAPDKFYFRVLWTEFLVGGCQNSNLVQNLRTRFLGQNTINACHAIYFELIKKLIVLIFM